MLPPSQALIDLQKRDREHIKLLSVFHFVFAGLLLLGIAFLFLHSYLMREFVMNSDVWKQQKMPFPPEQIFQFLSWFYWVAGGIMVIASILNILSGIFMQQRKYQIFSLVVAGVNCIHIPLGTLLGIFTLVVLTRYSVSELYRASAGSATYPNTPS